MLQRFNRLKGEKKIKAFVVCIFFFRFHSNDSMAGVKHLSTRQTKEQRRSRKFLWSLGFIGWLIYLKISGILECSTWTIQLWKSVIDFASWTPSRITGILMKFGHRGYAKLPSWKPDVLYFCTWTDRRTNTLKHLWMLKMVTFVITTCTCNLYGKKKETFSESSKNLWT